MKTITKANSNVIFVVFLQGQRHVHRTADVIDDLLRVEEDDGEDSGLAAIFGNGGAGSDIKPFLSGKRILTGEEL